MARFLLCFIVSLMLVQGQAQNWNASSIMQYSKDAFPVAFDTLVHFLRIPNDSHDSLAIVANVHWCEKTYRSRGFQVQTIYESGVPFVLAEWTIDSRLPTVLFYTQIDGQPVDPTAWHQPDPYQAALKDGNGAILDLALARTTWNPDWKLYARSVSDSKGPAVCLLTAIDILKKYGVHPAFNVKVIMDFQEELSSPKLPVAVADHRDLFAADMLVVMDGARHVSNMPTLTFGARGIATATLTVFGPKVPLHSGQYGNFAPNPVFGLARLLAAMKDEDGRVLIPGYYDGIHLTAEEKKLLREVPENAQELSHQFGFAEPEKVGDNYQEALQYPTLNVRGLRAAWTGDAVRTIIPDVALAEMDVRLVPETDGERLMQSIRQFILDQGFHLVDGEPTDEERNTFPKLAAFDYEVGYAAYRTDFDTPIGTWLSSALTRALGEAPLLMRTTGGSQPISPFITALGLPAVSVRIPNPDNNIHSPNENLRLGNFLEGIASCVGVLTESIKQ